MVSPDGGGANPSGNLGPGPVLMGMNQSSLAYLTPPAMAPGAIAYGAVAVPYYGQPLVGGGVVGVPGVAAPPVRQPEPRAVTFSYQNVEVLGRSPG